MLVLRGDGSLQRRHVGWDVAKLGDRWGRSNTFARRMSCLRGFGKDVARGLRLRCDWDPYCIPDAWITGVKWLGTPISPPYVGEQKCNDVAERFTRTLKEQCIYLHRFETLAES